MPRDGVIPRDSRMTVANGAAVTRLSGELFVVQLK